MMSSDELIKNSKVTEAPPDPQSRFSMPNVYGHGELLTRRFKLWTYFVIIIREDGGSRNGLILYGHKIVGLIGIAGDS